MSTTSSVDVLMRGVLSQLTTWNTVKPHSRGDHYKLASSFVRGLSGTKDDNDSEGRWQVCEPVRQPAGNIKTLIRNSQAYCVFVNAMIGDAYAKKSVPKVL